MCILAPDAYISGALKGRVGCADDCDDLLLDPTRRRLYAVGGAGKVTVLNLGPATAEASEPSLEGRGGDASATAPGTSPSSSSSSSSPPPPPLPSSPPVPVFRSLGEVPTSLGARTGCFLPGRDVLLVACPGTASAPPRLLVFVPTD